MGLGPSEDDLVAKISALQERAERAERDASEYQSQVHDLNERIGRMTSAATGAAATAEAALGRLISAQVVIDAAYALVDQIALSAGAAKMGIFKRPDKRLLRELAEAVELHRRKRPS